MASVKKYYWLKLNVNFFDKEEIKLIEGMQNGKDYIIFYMKLLLKSANTDGKLMFRDVIPYTVEMLSSVTNTNPDTVMTATDLFVKLGMMERLDNGALFMLETKNMVGCETEFAKKKREYRKKQALALEDNSKTKKDNVRQEIEIELEKEIEKDKKNTADAVTPRLQYLKRYKEFVVNSIPDVNIQVLDSQIMRLKKHIDDNLLEELEKSSYLKGLKDKKPGVWVFTVVKNINDIKLGVYRDKEISQEEKNTPSRRVL